jgi:sarcosine oxidase, subunit alpha
MAIGKTVPQHGAGRIEPHPNSDGPPPRMTRFSFDGTEVDGVEGEPLIAALLAAGIRVLCTMPRTAEARGAYCLVGRCSDCLVIVDGVPNKRACVERVRTGMAVDTQHGLGTWPEQMR